MAELEKTRETFSPDGKYCIRARAYWTTPLAGLPIVSSWVEIFKVPITIDSKPIFKSRGENHSGDLLDVLQSVERIAREQISALAK